MVCVCLSHVRYYFADTEPALYALLTNVTRLATPTFLLLSGFIASYVLSSGRPEARISVLDRGLFVLVAGHLLLSWADLGTVPLQDWIFGRMTVTDVIAVCLISAVFAFRLSTPALAVGGIVLAFASWPFAAMWTPETELGRYAGIVVFNVRSEASTLTDAALAPYLGLFLIGMCLSRWCARDLAARAYSNAARKLMIVGAILVALILVVDVSWMIVKRTLLADAQSSWVSLVQVTLNPRQKMPPSPAYLLFYSGVGLLIAGICLLGRPKAIVPRIVDWSSTLGRASFMCFVVQDWMLVLAPVLFGFTHVKSMTFWAAYLVAAIIVLHALAARWDRARANRFLTIGLKQSYSIRQRKVAFSNREKAAH